MLSAHSLRASFSMPPPMIELLGTRKSICSLKTTPQTSILAKQRRIRGDFAKYGETTVRRKSLVKAVRELDCSTGVF
ncbi:hypothetical protein V6Z11_A07G182200 [Gossypium hirsutum]